MNKNPWNQLADMLKKKEQKPKPKTKKETKPDAAKTRKNVHRKK